MTRCLLLALLVAAAPAAVFQYRVPVTTAKGQHQALCWLPPTAARIRGLVVAGTTSAERLVGRDPLIRQACRDQALGIVFLTCGLGAVDLDQVFADLAATSGYAELATAPLAFLGHSAGGPQAQRLATARADRCFALIQHRGGVPGGVPAGIPCLVQVGQFDEFAGTMRDADGRESWQRTTEHVARLRSEDGERLIAVVVEAGAGHFGWSTLNSIHTAAFLRAAAAVRIPVGHPDSAPLPPVLASHGWLAALPPTASTTCAAWSDYPDSHGTAAWYPDATCAGLARAVHARLTTGADRFLTWQDRTWVDAGARHFFNGIQWLEPGDTFRVDPAWRDTYPPQPKGPGPRWARAGQPVGHGDGPIAVRVAGGPLEAIGPRTLRLRAHELAPVTGRVKGLWLARSPAAGGYRATELVGMLPRGFRGHTRGQPQAIDFPPPADLIVGGEPQPLTATSDAGLAVHFYVAYGPAQITNGLLEIAELPVRSRLPITVTVVANQWGRGLVPLIQTAAPVLQTLEVRAAGGQTPATAGP